MPSFGENLRREREKRKFTLDQISQSTKIGTRMLQALEEDKFNQLPGGIFNKGFVRAYARCIGLDEEQTVADYLQASGETPPVMPEIPQEHPERPRIIEASTETPERPLPWGTFAALLLLAALALTLWSHRQKKERAAAPPAQPVATQPQPETSPSPSAAADSTSGAPAASLTSPPKVPALQQQAPQQQKVAPAKPLAAAATTSPATASPTQPAAAKTTSPAPPATGGFVIHIQAREDCWLRVTSDDKQVYSGNLLAGDERSIRAQNQLVVRVGNSGAVDLSFNGKKVAQPGQYGEARTITFGPQGVVPNPAPAPTTAPPPTIQE